MIGEKQSRKKVYRPLGQAVVLALKNIFLDGRYADRVIEYTLKQDRRRGARDRAFIADSVYTIVRYKRLYKALAEVSRIDSTQDIWRLLAVYLLMEGYTLPDWEEFRGINAKRVFGLYENVCFDRRILQSIPDWLDEMGQRELPDIWDEEVKAFNRQAPLVLRSNPLKCTVEQLREALLREGVDTVCISGYPLALEAVEKKNVFATRAFAQGWFEVQDASSQRVAPLLDVRPGMRVIDACAGAGGKSLHLAALMENKGSLISMDVEGGKLEELMRRARRAGVSNISPRVIENSKTIKRLEKSADRLLLDVPCSGLGVLRRNPDAKWKLKPEFLDQVRALQYEILSSYSRMLKNGGRMVYATCSIMPSENIRQVERFVGEYPEFRLLESVPVFSSTDGYDGFYMALLERSAQG